MSLFGKILLFLNVLAAIGFFMMAGLDWGKRYNWVEARLEHELRIDGLPLDETQKDREGGPLMKDLREKALQKLFEPAGGDPKHTQVEEAKRVRDELQKYIDDPAVKGTRGEKLAEVLMHLTTSMKERDQFKQMGTDDKKADEMQSKLDDLFNEATAGGEMPKHAPESRRALIAHLLFCSADILRKQEEGSPGVIASKGYQRCLATTGLVACTREVEAETSVLVRFGEDVRAGMARDREAYLEACHTLLAQIEDLAEKCERQKGVLKLENELVDKQRTLAETRQAELLAMTKALAAAREATQEQLKVQAEMEDQLYKSRREERDTLEKNLQLERQLRSLEKGR